MTTWRPFNIEPVDLVKGAFAFLGVLAIGVGIYITWIRSSDASDSRIAQLELKLNSKIEALDIKITGKLDRVDDRVTQDERTIDRSAAAEAEALKGISNLVQKLDDSSRALNIDFARISAQLSAHAPVR